MSDHQLGLRLLGAAKILDGKPCEVYGLASDCREAHNRIARLRTALAGAERKRDEALQGVAELERRATDDYKGSLIEDLQTALSEVKADATATQDILRANIIASEADLAEAQARIARYETASVQNDAGWRKRLAEAERERDGAKEASANNGRHYRSAVDRAEDFQMRLIRQEAALAAAREALRFINDLATEAYDELRQSVAMEVVLRHIKNKASTALQGHRRTEGT